MRQLLCRYLRNRTYRKLGLTIKTIQRIIIIICGIIFFCVYSLTVSSASANSTMATSITRQYARTGKTSASTTIVSTRISPWTSSSMWTTTQTSIASTKRLFLTATYFGRLGNHMFIYASLVGLARAQDREPFMSSGGYLESRFQVSHIRDDIKPNNWTVLIGADYATFNSKFMTLPEQNISISDMLQCWRYFQHAREEIRREFTLKADFQTKVQTTLATYRNRRENQVLVGVHVRRGDFLEPKNVKAGYGVAKASYFVNAFAKMRSILTHQNITFLIGSDDLDWCKDNINDSDIEILPQGSTTDHFAILSSCDHAIITGGTFGWWIGWLANGVTIYYKNFITKDSPIQRGFTNQDYYPLGWIGMEN